MRKALKWLAPIGLLSVTACSQADNENADESAAESAAAADATVAQPEAPSAAMPNGEATVRSAAEAAAPTSAGIPLTLPKMAYLFDYGFSLAANAIAPLQQRHADMCEALGPYQCQIVSLTRTGEKDDVTGNLELAVASNKARGFAAMLSAAAEQDGAESVRADITGEDVSKVLIDTEARVRSRIALRDRLMEVLETRRGKVEDLVEAERQVAAVNEEIDQAQSWLRETRGRVAYSRINLTYETANPGGTFLDPIEGAVGSLGSILGTAIAALIVILAIGGPLVLGALGVNRLRRRFAPAIES